MDRLDPDDPARDDAVTALRGALLDLARRHGTLEEARCACGRDECPDRDPACMGLTRLLRAGTRAPGGFDEPTELALRNALTRFGDAFGLLACPCGQPGCPAAAAGSAPLPALLTAVTDQWHGRAGHRIDVTPDWLAERAEAHVRACTALELLAGWLPRMDPASVVAVVDAYRACGDAPWTREARALGREAAALWLPAPDDLPAAAHVADAGAAASRVAGFDHSGTRRLDAALADLVSAVLTEGLIAPEAIAALERPFGAGRVAQLLLAAGAVLEAERSAAPPG